MALQRSLSPLNPRKRVGQIISKPLALLGLADDLGTIAGEADAQALYARPLHHYTAAGLPAVPVPGPRMNSTRSRFTLDGDVPDPIDPPAGCRFDIEPELRSEGGNSVARDHSR